MTATTHASCGELPGDPDAAIRQLYSQYAQALHGYAEQFCPDRASADDIVQETFIRAWRHLPQLSTGDRPIGPWLFRVARNLLIDANRAAQARPMTVPGQSAGEAGTDSALDEVLDRQLVSAALQHLSPAHQTAALGILLAITVLATAGRIEPPDAAPRIPGSWTGDPCGDPRAAAPRHASPPEHRASGNTTPVTPAPLTPITITAQAWTTTARVPS